MPLTSSKDWLSPSLVAFGKKSCNERLSGYRVDVRETSPLFDILTLSGCPIRPARIGRDSRIDRLTGRKAGIVDPVSLDNVRLTGID